MIAVATISRDALPVVLPLLAIVALAVAVVVHLYRAEGELPIFDLGVLAILITAVYSAVPLLGYWLANLQWTPLTYLPLYLWNPGPAEVGSFSTGHVLYLYSLAAAYLVGRGHVSIRTGPIRELRSSEMGAIALCCIAVIAYLWLLELVFDYSYNPSYRNLTAEAAAVAAAVEKIPYVVRQVSHNVAAILLLLKLCALVWLMAHWGDRRWRAALFVWLAIECATTIANMGSRTNLVMLLMAAMLLYHRLVRPLRLIRAAALGTLLIAGALAYGLARDLSNADAAASLAALSSATSSRWSAMNEFQALYGIAYDLHARKAEGALGPIPWHVYANEFSQIVPSQLLPFPKADPCVGYPIVDGIGIGCVLGVVAQAEIGFGWLELVVRGLAVGLVFAMIHRWYARRQDGYWSTVFYLCLCLWSYYTFRGSSFFIAYFVVYRFLPLLIGVGLAQLLVRRVNRAAVACGV
jgi:hypothetical protein